MAEKPTVSGGEALIAALAKNEIDTIFGIPGTHNLAAYAAMPAYGVRHVLTRHEQGAGYAADGYARSTGRVGVVLTTTGPAILNAAAAAAQAESDSVPVLFVAPGMPLRHPGFGNGLLHETRSQLGALSSLVSHSARVTSVEEIPVAVAQLLSLMMQGRPRAGYLEIPLDLLEERSAAVPVRATPGVASGGYRSYINGAATILASCSRPALIVGGGASGAAAEVATLADLLQAPVICTASGKGVLPDNHSMSLGSGVHHPAIAGWIQESDVVVAIGTELAAADWWWGVPEIPAPVIRIDIDPVIAARHRPGDIPLVGDASQVIGALVEELKDFQGSDGRERAAAVRLAVQAEARREGHEWLVLIESLQQSLPSDVVVAADSAMVCYYGALANLPASKPRSFLYPAGGGTLGFGLPAGIGAKIARPDTPVVVLQGDGGTMFTVAELATAVQERLSLPIVIADNGVYGEIRNEMVDRKDPVHAVQLGNVDYAALARAVGANGVTITDASLTGAEVERALRAELPTVIHVLSPDGYGCE